MAHFLHGLYVYIPRNNLRIYLLYKDRKELAKRIYIYFPDGKPENNHKIQVHAYTRV